MKQSVLRYAVSTVRWDAEQRIAIEAKLMQNVKQPVHPDDLDADEFIETDLVTMDDVMYEEDIEMEKKRVRRNIIIAILAAAVLGVGGMAAAVAFRPHGGTYESSVVQESSRKSSDASSTQEESSGREIKGTVIVPLDLPLTDQQDEPSLHKQGSTLQGTGYAASDSGWYWAEHSIDRNGHNVKPLYYSETDACVMLCARPNCLHEGNQYCTATTYAYIRISPPVWLDGYVYVLARKPYNVNTTYAMGGHSFSESSGSVVLLRYAADGAEITEVAEVYPRTEDDVMLGVWKGDLIAHRGQLWYSFLGGLNDRRTYTSSEFFDMGVYSPQTGTATPLLSDERISHSSLAEPPVPHTLVGAGDYVYFLFDSAARWDYPNGLNTGIWRISCVTGELQQVYKCGTGKLPQRYYVSGNKIAMCSITDMKGLAIDDPKFCKCRIYDISAEEEKTAVDASTRENPEIGTFIGFCADDTNIYLLNSNAEIWILDYDGNLKKQQIPSDDLDDWGDQSIMLHDGSLYVQYAGNWRCAPVGDVQSGSAEWKPAFSIDISDYLTDYLN